MHEKRNDLYVKSAPLCHAGRREKPLVERKHNTMPNAQFVSIKYPFHKLLMTSHTPNLRLHFSTPENGILEVVLAETIVEDKQSTSV